MNSEIKEIQKKAVPLMKKYGVVRAGIFGSYARGEHKKSSDIDLLIKPPKNMGFKFVKLEIELSKRLGRKVDLLSYNGLSPYLKDKILSEEVKIL